MADEFCGMRPAGARALLAAMNRDWRGLAALVTAVRTGVSEAGEDLDADATAAVRALQGYLDFLNDWGQELRWRLRYMEQLGATRAVPWPAEVAATVPFANRRQAARDGAAAGTTDAQRLAALWNKARPPANDPAAYEAFRAELERMLNSNAEYRTEPHYAGAFLRTFGSRNLAGLLAKLYRPGMSVQADGPTGPAGLPRDFAGLAELFANADRGGTLPADVRAAALSARPRILATFLRAGQHSDRFALDAAKRILADRRGPGQYESPHDDWAAARHILLDELWRRPGVAQALIADPTTFGRLAEQSRLPYSKVGARPRPDGRGQVDYQYDLGAVLWRALDPKVGTPQTRSRMWSTVIHANQFDVSGDPSAVSQPDVAKALARRAREFFPYMAYQEMNDPYAVNEKGGAGGPVPQPALPRDVRAKHVSSFLVALSRTKEGRAEMKAGYLSLVGDPLGPDFRNRGFTPDEVDRRRRRQDLQIGLIAALFRGYHKANLEREDRVDEVGDIIGAVFEVPIPSRFVAKRAVTVVVERLLGYGTGKLADWMAGKYVEPPPAVDTPRLVAAAYKAQVEHALTVRLGHAPTENQVDEIMDGFEARLRRAVERAEADHREG